MVIKYISGKWVASYGNISAISNTLSGSIVKCATLYQLTKAAGSLRIDLHELMQRLDRIHGVRVYESAVAPGNYGYDFCESDCYASEAEAAIAAGVAYGELEA